jgi:hypothetical protein
MPSQIISAMSLNLKTPKRTLSKRKVKKRKPPLVTCYDLYSNGDRGRRDLCPNCINYLDLVPKTKPQSQMGIRHYGCHGPTFLLEDDTSVGTTEDTSVGTTEDIVDEVEVEVTPGQRCSHPSTNCVTDSTEDHQRKKLKRSHSSSSAHGSNATIPVTPAETSNTDSANGAMMRSGATLDQSVELEFCKERLSKLLSSLNNSEAEVSQYKVQLELYHKREDDYVDALRKATAQVEEERENAREKERKYEDALYQLRQKTALKYKRKIDKLTSELQQAQNALASANNKMSNVVTMYERDDPYAAAEILIKELTAKNVSPMNIANGFLEALFSRKRCRKTMVNFVLAQESHLAEVSTYFKNKMYQELKQKFTPWMCLRELDLVATVSFRGYEVIRRIEFSRLESSKYQRGLFKSRQELSRLSKLLESHGAEILPYELSSNSVKFDLRRAVPWLLKQFKLWSHVQRGELVTTAATVDGGELAWQLTQVSAGVKICDERAINPLTGQRLFGESGYDKVQSRYVCFPLYVHIAKDNSEFYSNHLASFFNELNAIEDENPLGLQFTQGADMCSLHKTVKRGGAMKNKNYACYCCSIHKDSLAKPNPARCQDCIALQMEEPCYHQQVSDEALMQRLKEDHDDMVSQYPYLLNFEFKNSRIRSGASAVRDNRSDNRHIDFDMINSSITSRLQFRSLLENELRLRNKPIHQQVEANRIELKELLLTEQQFLLLSNVLSETSLEGAMIKLEKAIPCLLHLENRISDTMITFLFRGGIQLVEESHGETEALMSSIELIFNERLFGQPGSPSNWKFPMNNDGTMGEIKLSNWRARRVVEHIEPLVTCCVTNAECKNKWIQVFQSFKNVIKVCVFCSLFISLFFATDDVLFNFFHVFLRHCNRSMTFQMQILLHSKS